MSEPIQNWILYYRNLYPDWGSKTIMNELILDGYVEEQLACERTITRFLKSKKLVTVYEKNRPLPHQKTIKASLPHDCWQM